MTMADCQGASAQIIYKTARVQTVLNRILIWWSESVAQTIQQSRHILSRENRVCNCQWGSVIWSSHSYDQPTLESQTRALVGPSIGAPRVRFHAFGVLSPRRLHNLHSFFSISLLHELVYCLKKTAAILRRSRPISVINLACEWSYTLVCT